MEGGLLLCLMDRAALFIGTVTVHPETANSIKKHQCKLPLELELGDSQQCGYNKDNESEEQNYFWMGCYISSKDKGWSSLSWESILCSHLQCLLSGEEAGYSTSSLRRVLKGQVQHAQRWYTIWCVITYSYQVLRMLSITVIHWGRGEYYSPFLIFSFCPYSPPWFLHVVATMFISINVAQRGVYF